MRTAIRVFNSEGINRFKDLLSEMRADGVYRDPGHLLADPLLSTQVTSAEIDLQEEFSSRRECGEYFVKLLKEARADLSAARIDPMSNAGLWTWFSAALLPFLVAKGKKDERVGEESRLVFKPNSYSRFYRHLLAGPYLICNRYVDNPALADIVLFNSVTSPFNDFVEHIASRTQIVYHPETMKVLDQLYMDPVSRTPKAIKIPAGMPKDTGSIKRFGLVYNQLALVWDFFDMTSTEIEAILPEEFRRLGR